MACAEPSYARDMTGKAGIGVVQTTDGTPYLTVRYWMSGAVLELLASYGSHSGVQSLTNAASSSEIRAALGLLVKIGDQPRASLSVGLRPWLVYHAESQPQAAVSTGEVTRYGLELPLQGELFLTDNLGLSGSIGLTAEIHTVTTYANAASTSSVSNQVLDLRLGGGFAGGMGITYYF